MASPDRFLSPDDLDFTLGGGILIRHSPEVTIFPSRQIDPRRGRIDIRSVLWAVAWPYGERFTSMRRPGSWPGIP